MSEENNQANGVAAADGLRDVPTDITEYRKFVADGGLEHNEQVRGREEAEKAARDAGLKLAPGADKQDKPHQNGFQTRVNRLQRKIGERDQRIADLEKQVSAQTNGHPAPAKPDAATPAPAKPDAKPAAAAGEDKTPPRPQEKDFKTYSEFTEALIDWTADRKLEAHDAKKAERGKQSEIEKQNKAVIDAHNARVDEAKTRYDDWETAFEGLDDNSFSDAMTVFIFESDKGPDVTYYLATHRDELKRIRALSPLRQAAALEKIEDKLGEDETDDKGEDDKPAKAAPAKPAKPAKPADDEEDEEDEEEDEEKKPAARRSAQSKAPAPAKPLGGRGAADDAMPDPSNFAQYEKWSKRQQAKAKR